MAESDWFQDALSTVVLMHFGRAWSWPENRGKGQLEVMSCSNCEDFISGYCAGEGLVGAECVRCMFEKHVDFASDGNVCVR